MHTVLRVSWLAILMCLVSCGGNSNPEPEQPVDPSRAIKHYDYPAIVWDEGEKYVWNYSYIPEITVNIAQDEWNALLLDYDRSPATEMYIHCDVSFKRGDETIVINNAGFRLRGNTSRVRPEGNTGDLHSQSPSWRKCHFGINFKKFVDDPGQELMGISKFHLKWFNGDPACVRELFSYDLFRRDGIWTGLQDNYCRLWIHVEGDEKPAYFGVYNLMERVDKQYLKRRKEQFGSAKGNLWKCVLGSDMSMESLGRIGPDTEETDYLYELKESKGTYDEARTQLKTFIKNVNSLDDDEFYDWIREHCDVDFLLRTYAVNVVLGNWDDFWANANNYYLYFNSNDPDDYKVFLIPYDFDNCLGTTKDKGYLTDAVKQNPMYWGNKGVLMNRLMKYEECRTIYKKELLRLINPINGLADYYSASKRIQEWQESVKSYVKNDAGGSSSIQDKPASWSNPQVYRLLDPDVETNVFKIKGLLIQKL